MKLEKGITLIALIITIVVLLILAVVTIGAIQESKIIAHAKNAASKYEGAKVNEIDALASYEGLIDKNNPNGEDHQVVETIIHNETIPEGGTYTTASGTVYNAGQAFPKEVTEGDIYIYGDYEYRYNNVWFEDWMDFSTIEEAFGDDSEELMNYIMNGWGVRVTDDSKTEYGTVITKINEKNVTNMLATYANCISLKEIPNLPNNITNLFSTFASCTGLITVEGLPNSVTNLIGTFSGCTGLTTVKGLPNSVTNLNGAFSGCTRLTTVKGLPNSVTNLSGTFSDCIGLTIVEGLPNSVTNLSATFSGCTGLTTVVDLPNSVENMESSFSNCTSLTTVKDLPNTLKNMGWAFDGCAALIEIANIPNDVENMRLTFHNCKSLITVSAIPSKVQDMHATFCGCEALTGDIEINANPTEYGFCFVSTKKEIIITGLVSDEIKEDLAAQGSGNIKWK